MTNAIYVNAVGVEFRLNTGVDISAATLLEIHVKKPSGIVKWTAARYLTTQKITYTTVVGDLSEAGTYTLQAYVEWGSSSKHHGEAIEIEILAEFAVPE